MKTDKPTKTRQNVNSKSSAPKKKTTPKPLSRSDKAGWGSPASRRKTAASKKAPAKKAAASGSGSGPKNAGRTGEPGYSRHMPPRHSKNEMGTSGKKERNAVAKKASGPANRGKNTTKPSAPKAAPRQSTTNKNKAKRTGGDWYNKAVRRGFGRIS